MVKKRCTKEEMERGDGARYDCEKTTKEECTRLDTIKTRLQNPADPYLRGRHAGPQKEQEDGPSLWSKMMMVTWKK